MPPSAISDRNKWPSLTTYGGTLYNIACAYARAGRSDEALDTLEEALDRAVTNLAWIANDPDWSELRSHARFQQLLSRLR